MNISRKDIDEVNAVLSLKIVPEDYESRVEEIIKDYKNKVKLDGFRPGKVPIGLVRKMYRKPVLVEEVNKLISELLSKYFVDEKLRILGDPLPSEEGNDPIDWDNQTEFDFSFDIALAPEFKIELTKNNKVPYYTIKIDKKLRDAYIENYTRRFGAYKGVEKIETGDELLKASVRELSENGIIADDTSLSLSVIKDEEIKKKFIGQIKGSKLLIDLKKAWPNDTELASILKTDKEKLKDTGDEFEIEINDIERFVDSDINQEFFDKAFGKDTIKTEEEFMGRIDAEIAENLQKESEARFAVDAREMLIKKLKLKLPEEFLNKWLVKANEGKFSKEEIDKDFSLFRNDLEWQLIREEIVKDQDLKVSEEDILNYAKEVTMMQFVQYGLTNVPDDQLEHYAKEMLEKKEEKQKLSDKLYEDKVMAYIKSVVKLDEKKITTDDFNKLYEKKGSK